MSFNEVGVVLSLSEATARKQANRGIEQVRESLAGAGFTASVIALPGLLASSGLPTASSALMASFKPIIASATVKGSGAAAGAAGVSAKGVITTTTAKAAITATFAMAGAVAIVVALHLGGRNEPKAEADVPVAPVVAQQANVVAAKIGKSLADILAQKIDVKYWRDYPVEVLNNLKCRTGLLYACSETVERSCTLDLKQTGISVQDVLDKLAVAGGLELEIRADRVLVWKKFGDDEIASFSTRLHDPDRWIRCGAAWDLSMLGDKRVCPLLLQACADKDVGVSQWAAKGLLRHLNVLPFIAADKSAARVAAECALDVEARLVSYLNSVESAAESVGNLAYVEPRRQNDFHEKLLEFARDTTVNINLRVEAAGALIYPYVEPARSYTDCLMRERNAKSLMLPAVWPGPMEMKKRLMCLCKP